MREVCMKSSLAVLVGFLIAAMGLVGLIVPSVFVRLGWAWATVPGIYVSAAIDIVVGLVLIRAAPRSRSPVGLGVFAAVSLIGGVITPFLGLARMYAAARWWSGQSPTILRLWALFELTVGVLIVCAVVPRRRALRPATAIP
ncbi:MAG: hypothetical protein BGO98_26150 [Myxococcales bacterium 68-20]|nr:MAG: hypothetical protein BGO98_26150 [Myxococcales bacterium 68-20]